jgi:hypothetical protein
MMNFSKKIQCFLFNKVVDANVNDTTSRFVAAVVSIKADRFVTIINKISNRLTL